MGGLTENQQKQELIIKLSSQKWRLENIYFISNEEGETVKFKPNDIQQSILKNMSNYRDLILKYRQGGVSTLFIILMMDEVLFGGININNIFITHRQELLDEFFKKARFVYDNIPEEVKILLPKPTVDNANEMYFPKTPSGRQLNNSIKIALNVRGRTPTRVHISEFAFIDPKKQAELKQQIDQFRRTKITIETTANGIGNVFYNMCMNAKSKKGTYKLLFYPWYIEKRNQTPVPEDFELIGDEEHLKKLYKLSNEQIYWRRLKIEDANSLGFNGLDKFHEENPVTIESAFISSGVSVFNLTEKFIIQKVLKDRSGVRIFQEPQDNLIIGVDIAEGGITGDFSAFVAYNMKGEIVFTYKSRCNEYLLAKKLNEVFNYKGADGQKYLGRVVPENNRGRLFIKECEVYNWKRRIYHEIRTDMPIEESKQTNKFGFGTTKTSKDYIIRLFKAGIHKQEVEVSEEIKSEIDTYQFDSNNRPNAISPNHDDILIAAMIAFFGVKKIYGGLDYDEKKQLEGDRIEDIQKRDFEKIQLSNNTLQIEEDLYNDYYEIEEFNF